MNAKFVALNSMPLSRDIPMCGCQVIAKERKRDYIPFISTDEEDENDDQI